MLDINQPVSILCDYGLDLRHLNQLEEQLDCIVVGDLCNITEADIIRRCHQVEKTTVDHIRNALRRFVNGEIIPGRDVDLFEIPEELRARVQTEQDKWTEQEELEHRAGKGYRQEVPIVQVYHDAANTIIHAGVLEARNKAKE